MEVLLLQDIPEVGKKNDLLIVGDGYAMNFLLPQSKAMVATPTVRRRYAEQIKRRALEREQEKLMVAQAAKAIAGRTVTFQRKATKTGKLYAAVTEKNIVEALKEQHKLDVSEDIITIGDPIKALGDFDVRVTQAGRTGVLKVSVKQEK
ncbi:MAG TPA: 50S ribosomal protein L9 [Candidatus Peribacteraceae bacterium]|nr:50S ribosomal protein L9 [Candidatus Peribacteraceae bacterium]